MEIVWLGHSSLRLQSRGVTLITDPYADSVGLSIGNPKADIVTISNGHPHHSASDAVDGSPRVLKGPGSYEVGHYYITGTGTARGGSEGDREVNTVFTIRAEGLNICHLGDLSRRLSPGQVAELNQPDILCVPAGGMCTISVSDLAELVNLIGPRIVIPLHYWVDGLNVELDPLDRILGEMGVADVTPQARLNVTSSNLPRELSVVVLQRST